LSSFTQELSERCLGAAVLARLARERGAGDLVWTDAGKSRTIYFAEGRPELVMDDQGRSTNARDTVVRVVRAFAIAMRGSCAQQPSSRPVATSLGIDTLGETLVALMRGLTAAQLVHIWTARRGERVSATASFERFAAVLPRVGGATLAVPAAETVLDTLVSGVPEEVQRSWVAMIALGGVSIEESGAAAASAAEPPVGQPEPASTPPKLELPRDPKARRAAVEIERRWREIQGQSHYDVLGVAHNASKETIRQAYFEVARAWHSDRFADVGLDVGWLRKAEEIFRAAGEAQKVLTDDRQRQSYDFLLDRKRKGLPTDVNVILEAEGYFTRAKGLVRRGQAAAAEPLLRKAVELNRGEAEFWAYLGFAVHAAKGRDGLDEARAAINEALQRKQKLDEAYEFLGRICRVEGLRNEAIKNLTKALEINPKDVAAQRELRLIKMRSPKEEEGKSALGGLLGGLLRKK
jgi:curved DNA-binding protein CbpA